MRDAKKTIGNILDKQTTIYLSSIDEDGFPNTRAMLAPRKREEIKILYFTTNTSSKKVEQFRKNPNACVYFCDKRFYRGVMLKGKIEVLEEAAIKEAIWKETDTMYYPKGVTDPDYCVLRFIAENGKYYSNFKTEDFEIE